MRSLTILIGALMVTLISTQVSAKESCKIVTGYGTSIGFGKTKSAALEAARLNCGTHMIDQYFAQRRDIAEDVKDDLALACVNLNCQ